MHHPRREAAPSQASAALQLLAAKRQEQELRKAALLAINDDKENEDDDDSFLNDFDSPDLKPRPPPQCGRLNRNDGPAATGSNSGLIDALTGSLSNMAVGPMQQRGRPTEGTMQAVHAASRLPLPADSDNDNNVEIIDDSSEDLRSGDGGEEEEDEEDGAPLLLRRIQGNCLPPPPAPPATGPDPLVLGDAGEFRLEGRVACKLYPHQVEGVKWLWSLHMLKKGGILGDDMGLGEEGGGRAFLHPGRQYEFG